MHQPASDEEEGPQAHLPAARRRSDQQCKGTAHQQCCSPGSPLRAADTLHLRLRRSRSPAGAGAWRSRPRAASHCPGPPPAAPALPHPDHPQSWLALAQATAAATAPEPLHTRTRPGQAPLHTQRRPATWPCTHGDPFGWRDPSAAAQRTTLVVAAPAPRLEAAMVERMQRLAPLSVASLAEAWVL
eukprot:363309-Chlamydomonas_euryale.AAC.43